MTTLNLTEKPPRSPRESIRGLVFLPRMIDIARSFQQGGDPGEYQVGLGVSSVVLASLKLTREDFLKITFKLNDDDEIAREVIGDINTHIIEGISKRLLGLTVADVPPELKEAFEGFYGANIPQTLLVFDILEDDDRKLTNSKAN